MSDYRMIVMGRFNRNWTLILGALLLLGVATTSPVRTFLTDHVGNTAYALVQATLSIILFWHFLGSTRQRLGRIEKGVYALALVLLVGLFVASSLGYFNDWLTYGFAVVFVIAALLLLKRLFSD